MIRLTPEEYEKLQAKAPKRRETAAQKLAAINEDVAKLFGPGAVPLSQMPMRSKHGAVKTVRHGIKFDSKHEADCYDDLLLRVKSGAIRNLQRQVSFPIAVEGQKVHRVVLDFWYQEAMWYQRADGPRVLVWEVRLADAKSSHTASLPAWKRAKALFEAAYGVTVRELL